MPGAYTVPLFNTTFVASPNMADCEDEAKALQETTEVEAVPVNVKAALHDVELAQNALPGMPATCMHITCIFYTHFF